MMKRRDFFRLAAGAGAALLLPEFVVPAVAAEPERMPITLAWMQETYWGLAFGNEHPTLITMSHSRFEEFVGKIHPEQRFFSSRRKFCSLRFNGADICHRNFMGDDLVLFMNENRTMDRRFTRILRIGMRL